MRLAGSVGVPFDRLLTQHRHSGGIVLFFTGISVHPAFLVNSSNGAGVDPGLAHRNIEPPSQQKMGWPQLDQVTRSQQLIDTKRDEVARRQLAFSASNI